MTRPIVVVAGFQRCGTSLAMRMLDVGGLPVYCDPGRRGTSYETDRITGLPEDTAWLDDVEGRALKALEPGHFRLPKGRPYRFIWLDRDPREQARSAVKFMTILGGLDPSQGKEARRGLARMYREERPNVVAMLRSYPDSTLTALRFEDLIRDPGGSASILCYAVNTDELGIPPLDPSAMAAQVVERPTGCLPYLMELHR